METQHTQIVRVRFSIGQGLFTQVKVTSTYIQTQDHVTIGQGHVSVLTTVQ